VVVEEVEMVSVEVEEAVVAYLRELLLLLHKPMLLQ
jgi:hypothetical protein